MSRHPPTHHSHLLTLDAVSRPMLHQLLDSATHLATLPAAALRAASRIDNCVVCTLFFEPSTRTRCSFQIAAWRLGATVLNVDAKTSSTQKGETAKDMFRNLQAMGVSVFVIRHDQENMVSGLAELADASTTVINAGDGCGEHPTQGLIDMLTLRQLKGADFSQRRVLIVGDIAHSRVARSDVTALRCLGVTDIRLCGPRVFLPNDERFARCQRSEELDTIIEGVDVIMMLRVQHERMPADLFPSLTDYCQRYQLNQARLQRAAPDALVLHPGPINRGIEISDEVADGRQSGILRQTANGIAVRLAVLNGYGGAVCTP